MLAPSDEALGFVAASVLEDLCVGGFDGFTPESIYHEIVERARVDDKLRAALGLMYSTGIADWFRSEVKALGVHTHD